MGRGRISGFLDEYHIELENDLKFEVPVFCAPASFFFFFPPFATICSRSSFIVHLIEVRCEEIIILLAFITDDR